MRRDWDAFYRRTADPWNYEHSPYEHAKYAATLRAIGRGRFRAGLEVGCSIGVLSALLARRCGRFVGIDPSATAIGIARERQIPRARFVVGAVPKDLPRGPFDLVVLSEVLYFLERKDVRALARRIANNARDVRCVVATYRGRNEAVLSPAASDSAFRQAIGRRGGRARRIATRGIWTLTLYQVSPKHRRRSHTPSR